MTKTFNATHYNSNSVAAINQAKPINQRPEGTINRAKGTLTGTEGAYSKQT
jgi:hypothetical protein